MTAAICLPFEELGPSVERPMPCLSSYYLLLQTLLCSHILLLSARLCYFHYSTLETSVLQPYHANVVFYLTYKYIAVYCSIYSWRFCLLNCPTYVHTVYISTVM